MSTDALTRRRRQDYRADMGRFSWLIFAVGVWVGMGWAGFLIHRAGVCPW